MDFYYLVLVVPAFIFSLFAQFLVKSTFNKYSKESSGSMITGAEVARFILDRNGLNDVEVEPLAGNLTDHYDPRTKIVRLSQNVYSSNSLAAIGVAAHETGHALQHKGGYGPLMLRSGLVPLANIGSSVGPYMAIFGLMFNMQFLLNVGIVLFAGAVLFYLITLPVEFNASRRAVAVLNDQAIVDQTEIKSVKAVLRAAALTYVASAAVAMASLMRLILLSRNRNN
jgi:Zn-dependent membrane protease YugP